MIRKEGRADRKAGRKACKEGDGKVNKKKVRKERTNRGRQTR